MAKMINRHAHDSPLHADVANRNNQNVVCGVEGMPCSKDVSARLYVRFGAMPCIVLIPSRQQVDGKATGSKCSCKQDVLLKAVASSVLLHNLLK